MADFTNETTLKNGEHDDVASVAGPQDNTATKLSKGFFSSVSPTILTLETQLAEIALAQQAILDDLMKQGHVINDDPEFIEVIETMSQLPLYHTKLITIRKEMMSIADKTTRMKKRVQKLETKREKYDHRVAQEREQERQREESLRALPVAELTSNEKSTND
eukprot:m.40870 g.40870  ORF g.40870 m.40870 type:complete len:162 (-) comp14870_c0_seq1:117-602(-)